MKRKDLWFWGPALLSAFAVIRLASLPAALVTGKLPVFLIGAAMITLAWRIQLRGGLPQRWVLLLFGAPVASFAMLFATLEWGT
ncbi:hypothetical protein OF829_03970 [Sphingomonas sp. LB-2]|uniref:hypothetical protein n=1 Tax=Sphingomonas caeni TaxID=2984949 RepID=UPI002231EAEC|nr:hypothetical protein [Sphingomonas caeni]MCW3846385.1 hypothetical protein [Sphingomonas caeni]